MLPSPLHRSRQLPVFPSPAIGQQHPKRIDAQRGAERWMEQGEDPEHNCDGAGPGLKIPQAPAHENATNCDQQQASAQRRHDNRPERPANHIVIDHEACGAPHEQYRQRWNQEKHPDRNPKDAERWQMLLKAAAGYGVAYTCYGSNRLAAFWTDVEQNIARLRRQAPSLYCTQTTPKKLPK